MCRGPPQQKHERYSYYFSLSLYTLFTEDNNVLALASSLITAERPFSLTSRQRLTACGLELFLAQINNCAERLVLQSDLLLVYIQRLIY